MGCSSNILFALESWMKERKNLVGLLVGIVILGGLIGCAVWLNQPVEGEVPTSASQMAYEKASVTAVLEDGAVPDYEDAEGRRVGTQELEIRILTGTHKGEIMSLTNYMSALFNVDVEKGDQIIVRIMTDEDGSYYASLFNYNRGIVLGVFVLIFFILLAVLGGKKGLGALLGLLFTLASIWFVLIPCLIRGIPAIAVTVGVVAVTAAGALVLLNGFSLKEDIVMMYPTPTVWSSHVYIALDEAGTAGIDALLDEDIQRLAWEKHGFRTGVYDTPTDAEHFGVSGIANEITQVAPMPDANTMDRIIKALS